MKLTKTDYTKLALFKPLSIRFKPYAEWRDKTERKERSKCILTFFISYSGKFPAFSHTKSVILRLAEPATSLIGSYTPSSQQTPLRSDSLAMADTMGSHLVLNFIELVNNPEKAVVFVIMIVFICLDIFVCLWLIYAMIRHRDTVYCHVWGQGQDKGKEVRDDLLVPVWSPTRCRQSPQKTRKVVVLVVGRYHDLMGLASEANQTQTMTWRAWRFNNATDN